MKRSYQQRQKRSAAYRDDESDKDDDKRTTANGNESDRVAVTELYPGNSLISKIRQTGLKLLLLLRRGAG